MASKVARNAGYRFCTLPIGAPFWRPPRLRNRQWGAYTKTDHDRYTDGFGNVHTIDPDEVVTLAGGRGMRKPRRRIG